MGNHRNQSALVLKYAKRRYDGGTEIDQIRVIENRLRQPAPQAWQPKPLSGVSIALPDEPELEPSMETDTPLREPELTVGHQRPMSGRQAEKQTPKRPSKRIQALITGPLEICVGVVGMLTALLAMFTFHYCKNPDMVSQSRDIFRDCWLTFRKGILDTLVSPYKFIRPTR